MKYQTDREKALDWWFTLTTEQKETYFFKYMETNYTPALTPNELTGREIQNIWSVKIN